MTASIKGLGPAMLMTNPKPLDFEQARRLREALQNVPYNKAKFTPEEHRRATEQLAAGTSSSLGFWRWRELEEARGRDPNSYGFESRIAFTNFSASNAHRFEWAPGQKFMMIYFGRRGSNWLGPFPPDDDPAKVEFLLERWKLALEVLQPEFTVMDDFEFSIAKRKGKDLRRFGWGAAVYGPALAKQIGRDKLLSAPAFKVEELAWGGIWVQAAKNPFEAMPVAVQAVEKHLGLKQLFGRSRGAEAEGQGSIAQSAAGSSKV